MKHLPVLFDNRLDLRVERAVDEAGKVSVPCRQVIGQTLQGRSFVLAAHES